MVLSMVLNCIEFSPQLDIVEIVRITERRAQQRGATSCGDSFIEDDAKDARDGRDLCSIL
jgi:hypothetical protein